MTRKFLLPTLKFKKFISQSSSLTDRISRECKSIPEGSVTIVFSHKNLDNIAKYHILNRISNLYFDGSLPKNWQNQYKFSDFKYETAIRMTFHEKFAIRIDDNSIGHGYFKEIDESNSIVLEDKIVDAVEFDDADSCQ